MPLIVISTNIQRSAIPDGFLKGFSKLYANAVGREEKAVNCSLYSGVEMIKDGTDEPACVITMRHTIAQDVDGRRNTTKILLDFIKTQWNIAEEHMSRFTVVFLQPSKDEIGTYSGLLSDKK